MKFISLLLRWRRYWHERESSHGLIARSFVLVALFVLAGKIAGAVKEILSARHFGVSAEMDAFVFVFNLVSWPAGITLPILAALLVPLYVQLRTSDRGDSLEFFRGEVHGLILLVGGVLGVLFAGLLVLNQTWMAWAGLSPITSEAIRHLLWPLAGLVPVALYGALLSTELWARQRHLNTLLEGVPALVVSMALLISSDVSISLLVWSTLAGFFCQTLLLHAEQWRHSCLPRVRLSFRSHHWTVLGQGAVAMILAQVLQGLTSLIDQFWAVSLGEGALATMGYAQRLFFLILGLSVTAIGRATLPVFSKLAAEAEAANRGVALRWALLLAGLGVAVLVVLWPLAVWGVSVLFERGAFTAADTLATASFFRHSLLQLPFYFPTIVVLQWVLATRRYRVVLWLAVVNLLLKVLANLLLVPVLGLDGFALATTAMYGGSLLFLMYLLRVRKLHQ